MIIKNSRLRIAKARVLTSVLIMIFSIWFSACSRDHVAFVKVIADSTGQRLTVDSTDFLISGVNWDYYPIGTNYAYQLWEQPDSIIIAALANEMKALKAMGVNTIRQYYGIPPKWVKYIYETYSIFTILNHPFARYGIEINGEWVAKVDYSDQATREAIVADVNSMVQKFRDVPGVLMWLLGNENNYGLFWKSAETSNLPGEESSKSAQARHLYSLLNESIRQIHIRDNRRPVAIANGDIQFIDLIAAEIENLDVFGCNVYRGVTFGDLFQVVNEKLGIPILLTEFGADAYHALENREDPEAQATYLLGNWQEIYQQSSGNGDIGNCIGGLTFQFTDGWWKYGLDTNLDVHDINASWSNGGYSHDFLAGKKNMNEEWFGICAKGAPDSKGLYQLYPRAAYYTLQQVHSLNPYASGMGPNEIQQHFSNIKIGKIEAFLSVEDSTAGTDTTISSQP